MHRPGENLMFFLLLMVFSLPALPMAQATTITADSCSQEDVQAAINQAQDGDTVLVPAGECEWEAVLPITKGIALIGAGQEKTTIVCNPASEIYGLMYTPDDTSLLNDIYFRISGFKFIAAAGKRVLTIRNLNNNSTPISNIRIDHNTFINAPGQSPVYIEGDVYGVADNNIFAISGSGQSALRVMGNQVTSWKNHTFSFGSASNFYIEDNRFNVASPAKVFISSGQGGRWAARFNTFVHTGSYQPAPAIDAHGNQPMGVASIMGIEVYKNAMTVEDRDSFDFVQQRGGMGIVFGNIIETGGGYPHISVREEHLDSITVTGYSCDDLYSLGLGDSCSSDGETQHVNRSYYWNNTDNGVYLEASIGADYHYLGEAPKQSGTEIVDNIPSVLVENRDFWGGAFAEQENNLYPFDGKAGVGWGLYSNIPTTCTPGVAYWATDRGEWDKTHGGPDGQLYKCTSPNHWELYYRPYIYPHPLRVVPFGVDICGEGEITEQCWCQGMKTKGYCMHGYYYKDGNDLEGYPTYDVNQDGDINIQDIQLIVNVILGSAANSRADVNGSGTTDVSDVQEVVNEIVD